MFQSMYQPQVSSWLTLFKSIEWQMLFLCVILSGALGVLAGGPAGWLLLPGLAGLLFSGLAALYTGVEASRIRADQWTSVQRIQGTLLIALLNLFQPWARFQGRIKGTLQLWKSRRRYPEDQRLWGNMDQRDRWLRLLEKHLRGCGWRCEPSGEWETSDLVVRGPGFYEVRLVSVYEEVLHRGFHWVRFRLEGKRRSTYYLGAALVAAGMTLIALAPPLLPLALPLAAFALLLARSRRHTFNAISQAALECGIALEMPEVDPHYQG
jgi:hypothetical protein